MDFEIGHFSHRWQHHSEAHEKCQHAPKEKDDLGRMGLVLSIGRATGGIAALGWTVYAARKLQSDWGRLSAVLSYASVASIGTDLGIPLALTKLACRNPTLDTKAVAAAIRRRTLAGSIASIVLVFAWINTSSAGGRWGLAALYGISVTVSPITSSFLSLLRGRAIGTVEAYYTAGKQLVMPVLGILAIETGLGIFGVLASYVIVDAGSALVIARISRKHLTFSATPDAGEEQELRLRETIPLSASSIVGNAYERVDSAMLAPLAGTTAIGIYRMISPIYGAILMPAKAFGDTAAVGAGRGTEDPRTTATKFAIRAAVVTVPLAVLLALLGPPILPHVLSVKKSVSNPHPINWNQAAAPLRILMIAAIPSAALAVLTPIALMGRRDRVFVLSIGALVTNIALNLLLVPSWGMGLGAKGAAIAFLATETALAIVLWAMLPAKEATVPAAPALAAPNPAA